MKVFVSSSWRNQHQPEVVAAIKSAGHEVYDFRNPHLDSPGGGFAWSEIDAEWRTWTPEHFRESLDLARVQEGFDLDMKALQACDICVMVQPSGRSAALELGWAAGAGKTTIVLLAEGEPELMLKMADHFCLTLADVMATLAKFRS